MAKADVHFTDLELRLQAIEAWKKHAKTYRETLPEYRELLDKKRELKKSGGCKTMKLNKVEECVIADIPEVPFFRIESEVDALNYLVGLNYRELNYLVYSINCAIENYAYLTVRSRIYDFKMEIKLLGKQKPYGYYDPGYYRSTGPRASFSPKYIDGSGDR